MNLAEFVSQSGRGRGVALARELGVSQPTVSDWCTGKKRVPVERCSAIERATNGAVTRRDLRPDDWQAIWPELATKTEPATAGEG
jgi:DNA-binding transcriptional regulator YdaS (Cro superfamily)